MACGCCLRLFFTKPIAPTITCINQFIKLFGYLQILHDLSDGYILNITDITNRVKEEALLMTQNGVASVNCPSERPYLPTSQATCHLIGLET